MSSSNFELESGANQPRSGEKLVPNIERLGHLSDLDLFTIYEIMEAGDSIYDLSSADRMQNIMLAYIQNGDISTIKSEIYSQSIENLNSNPDLVNQVYLLAIKKDYEILGFLRMFKQYFDRGTGFERVLRQPEGVYICGLGIKKEYQKKGFGRALLQKSLEDARLVNPSAKWAYLLVYAENTDAIRFYIMMGFVNLGIFPDYPAGPSIYIMGRALD